jgi:type IV pilus assembly protein PilB
VSQARQPVTVGQYFLDRGKISAEDLARALAHKNQHGYRLGQSLVALELVTEVDLVEALRHQARFPCIHLTPGIVEPIAALRLPARMARRHRAIVLNQVAGHVTVAMEDPADADSVAELGRLLDAKVFPVYAEPSAIARVRELIYGSSDDSEPEAEPEENTGESEPSRPAPERTVGASSPTGFTDAPDDQSAGELVRETLVQALDQGASDIHVEPRSDGLVVRHRIDGVLVEQRRVPRAWAGAVLDRIKRLSKLDATRSNQPQSGRILFGHRQGRVEMRVSTTPSVRGEGAVLSLNDQGREVPGLDDLGLAAESRAALEKVLEASSGMILVTGPARSGKTTTLYALLRALVGSSRKLVTLEDPVAHPLDGVLQVGVDPRNGLGFDEGLRSVLGQDPDVVLIGELRDQETCRQAVHAALNGRLVMAGLNGPGATDGLCRLAATGIEPYLLGTALQGVVDQRLVRRLCEACRTVATPDPVLLERLGIPRDETTYHEGAGCQECNGTGFRGRVALLEVTPVGAHLRELIRLGTDPEPLTRALREDAVLSLRADGLRRAREGHTSLQEVLAATAGD